MAFDVDGWKRALGARLRGVTELARDAGATAYGALCAMTIWPLVDAAKGGDGFAVGVALTTAVASVGSNLVAGHLQQWMANQTGEADIAAWASEAAAQDERLRDELDVILGKLDAVAQAQQALASVPSEREAFLTALRDELGRLGNLDRFAAHFGDVANSVIVTGHRNTVLKGKRNTIVKGKRNTVVHGNLVIAGPSQTRDSSNDARALERYREHLVRTHSGLPLWDLDQRSNDPQRSSAPLELAQVYIKLDTTTRVGSDDDLARGSKAKRSRSARPAAAEEARPLGALEAVLRQRCTVLLGEPGSGKSTFLTFLILCLARHSPRARDTKLRHLPGWPTAATLPIPVVLRDFARCLPVDRQQPTAGDLWDFIQDWLKGVRLLDAAPALERALHEGTAVVLFDGLDEVAGDVPRAAVRAAVTAFAACHPQARCIVTCRTLSYQDPAWQLNGWPSFTLAPFDDEQIGAFIKAWYAEWGRVGRDTEDTCRKLAASLTRAVHRSSLLALARNPLLLTQMALVHTHDGELPDARAQLYETTVDLLLWRWEEVKGRGSEDRRGPRALLEQAAPSTRLDLLMSLRQLAYEVHRARGGEGPAVADIPEAQLGAALRGLHPNKDKRKSWTDAVIAVMKLRAGLLLERTEGVYAFPHRTFQEFLAGVHLAVQGDFAAKSKELLEEGAFWREVVLLAVGWLVHVRSDIAKPLMLATELCPSEAVEDERTARRAWQAGEVLREVGKHRLEGSELGRQLAERVPRALTHVLSGGHLQPGERVAAGETLAALGDPRFRADAWFLPDEPLLGFVEIPAGSFIMGSDKARDPDAYDDELPQHRVTLPRFFIARYPVTVAQLRAFVDDRGRVEDQDSPRGAANAAATWVHRKDALAYTEWLTEKLCAWDGTPELLARLLRGQVDGQRWRVTLPSEAEWERAARGTDGRLYPWGNEPLDVDRANFYDTGVHRPSPVGCFPRGATPSPDDLHDGIHDLSGNVWEWTRSVHERYPYDAKDGREDLAAAADKRHAARGGAFHDGARGVRAAVRYPYWGGYDIGFRVVVSPF